MPVSETGAARRGGSTPPVGTISCTVGSLVAGVRLISGWSVVRFHDGVPICGSRGRRAHVSTPGRSSPPGKASHLRFVAQWQSGALLTRLSGVRVLPGRLKAHSASGQATALSRRQHRFESGMSFHLPSVAQRTEPRPSKPWAAGSNPARGSSSCAASSGRESTPLTKERPGVRGPRCAPSCRHGREARRGPAKPHTPVRIGLTTPKSPRGGWYPRGGFGLLSRC